MSAESESRLQQVRRAIVAVVVAVIGRMFMPNSEALVDSINRMQERKERLRESQRNHLAAEGGDRAGAHWHLGAPEDCIECHGQQAGEEVLP